MFARIASTVVKNEEAFYQVFITKLLSSDQTAVAAL